MVPDRQKVRTDGRNGWMDGQRQNYIRQGIIRKFSLGPLKVENVQSHTYCINMYGKIHQNTKGFEHCMIGTNTVKKFLAGFSKLLCQGNYN